MVEDDRRPCFAQGQPSKPQSSTYRNGDEADQRDGLNDAGFKKDLEVFSWAHPDLSDNALAVMCLFLLKVQ